jgi:hypothetical protein
MLAFVVFYLVLGGLWVVFKIYLDVRQEHLPAAIIANLTACNAIVTVGNSTALAVQTACFGSLLLDMKWILVPWMLTWPISLARTLTRDPLRVATDLIFYWSQRRYVAVIKAALAASSSSAIHTDDKTILLWSVLGPVIYLAIGFIWTHFKLYIDVWQGTLPPSLDQEARRIYSTTEGEGNADTAPAYWPFIRKIKWLVLQWLITWPMSMFYTLMRHPLRIAWDFLYSMTQRKYAAIVSWGMARRNKDKAE